MEASALSGWTHPGHDPWEDMPHTIPLGGGGGGVIPPPAGATFIDPTMSAAFPGLAAAPPMRRGTSHPNLPALEDEAESWHPNPALMVHHPYANWPYNPGWNGFGYPSNFNTPAAGYFTPHPALLPPWPHYSPWNGGQIPLAHEYSPQWGSYSPWPGGFKDVEEGRGRKKAEVNWFLEGAKRSKSQQRSKGRKSKSPHHMPFPGFGGTSYFDEPEEYYDDEDEEERGHEHGETDWDFLDGFSGLSLGDRTPRKTRKRSVSFGGGTARPSAYHRRSVSNPIYQGYHITYEQHMERHGLGTARETDLPYRPSSWRADYSVKGGGMMQTLGIGMGLNRSRSDVKEINDNQKRTLHPHLLAVPATSGSPPPISLDLRLNPTIPSWLAPSLNLLTLPQTPNGQVSQIDLLQFATQPPSTAMRLFHKRLPWYIDIDVSGRRSNRFITVQDVINALFINLTGQSTSGGKSQVSAAEYWCGEMGDHVEPTPPPPPQRGLPGSTPLLGGLSPLPGFGGGGGGQRRIRHTAREQVSMSWRIRGRLAHHIAWAAWRSRGEREEVALVEAAKAEQEELARGVRRVDWLAIGANVDDQRAFRWIGLKKARKGMWEIVTEV